MVGIAECVPVMTLIPRFILSLLELYSRELQDRLGSGMDTAFGFSMRHCVGQDLIRRREREWRCDHEWKSGNFGMRMVRSREDTCSKVPI